ncbi:MAG: cation:proton antiporter [Pseudomonadota bacterium]
MTGEMFLNGCLIVSITVLLIAMAVIIARIVRGPTLPDRILGLDTLVTVSIGVIAVFGIITGFPIYVDIAIALGLVGFLSTIALANFLLRCGDGTLTPRDERAQARGQDNA